MTEEEKEAVETLRKKTTNRKLEAFNYLGYIDRLSPEDLINSGYRGKTNAEAMQLAFRDALKSIASYDADFLKQFPD